ncbi:MAG: hypothetical protein IJ870_00520 [Alphaproteobacteria bacterium]|nr:hypothetical protein [Alphaproteobacteria bacterium]
MDYVVLFLEKISSFLNEPETLKLFINNRFLMICLVIVLLKIKYTTYSNIYLSALVNIFGTLLHEMSHFLVGLFLNAHPSRFDLFPKKQGGGYVMGSVGFQNIRFYNAVPASLAPLLLLVIGYYFNIWFFKNIHVNYLNYILYLFLQTIIIENAIPSSTDFKVAFSYPFGVLFYAFIFVFSVIYLI